MSACRAGRWVAEQVRAAGLKPAGDNGTFFQTFPVHESRVEAANLSILRDGPPLAPRFLRDFSVRAADDLPAAVEGPLVFAGCCRAQDLARARGKVAVCVNTRRSGLTTGGEQVGTPASSAQRESAIEVLAEGETDSWTAAASLTMYAGVEGREPGPVCG